jgi:Ribonuclease G/E
MSDMSAERRASRRNPLVLAVEVIELPRGAKLLARTSDVSRTGCYIDTLNPVPQGSQVRVRITHFQEVFEAVGRVIYVSPGLGMGVTFETVAPNQQALLDHWLETPEREF